MKVDEKYVAAIDIGYSNLKIMHGKHKLGNQTKVRGNKVICIPATAIKKEELGHTQALNQFKGSECIEVIVNEEVWVVGVKPNKIGEEMRQLNRDFSSTDSYKAMYYGALSEMETDTIDLLVTGLPVDQSLEPEFVKEMQSWMEGIHKVGNKRNVTVKKVVIIPQPAGAFMDFSMDSKRDDLVDNGTILVIDPGFYSVDHIVIEEGEYKRDCSGTSLFAVSAILKKCVELIKIDHGRIEPETIENAIQAGKSKILVRGKNVIFSDYLKKSSEIISEKAINVIKQNIRNVKNIDLTLLVGGGGEYYASKAEDKLSNCADFEVAIEPHLAIVRGYYTSAKDIVE